MTLWMRSTPLAEIATSHYRNSVIAVCLLGLLASALSFFLQVGAFNENGLTGMFELEMILLLWETPIGTSTVYRVSGVIVLLLTFLAATFSNSISVKSTILRAALGTSYLIGTCMSVLSFSLVGHTSESSLASQLFISLHVCAAFWWIGSLYSLWFSCHTNNINELQSHLYQFGRAAKHCGNHVGRCWFLFNHPTGRLGSSHVQHCIWSESISQTYAGDGHSPYCNPP